MPSPTFIPRGIRLSDEQRSIVASTNRLVIAEANAGAAKTTTLACRIAEALSRGEKASAILALTYTEIAVTALRDALERIGVDSVVRRSLRIETFEQFSAASLQRIEGAGVRHRSTPESVKAQVLTALERVGSNDSERYPQRLNSHGEASVEGLLAAFLWLKGTLLLQVEAAERSITPSLADELGQDYTTLRVFLAFEALRWSSREERPAFRTPGDATHDLAKLLLHEDTFVDDLLLPRSLGLLVVDEMHDTNRAMFTVLTRLLQANPTVHFLGVGDRDQVLHAVAGADADFMAATFDREIAPATRLPLTGSYRFGAALANASGRLAGKPYPSFSDRRTEIRLVGCDRAAVGDEGVGEQDLRVVDAILHRDGLPAKMRNAEIAVLLRQPHQSIGLENLLVDRGIDYVASGFVPYLMRREIDFVRGLLAYGRDGFATVEVPATRVRLLESMMLLSLSFIDSQELPPGGRAHALAEAASSPANMMLFTQNHILRNAQRQTQRAMLAAIDCIRGPELTPRQWMDGFLKALEPHRVASRVMVTARDVSGVNANIQTFLRSAQGYDSIESFLSGLNEREWRLNGMNRKDAVLLASIEAVKGLEFEHVLIPGLSDADGHSGEGGEADARNLLYVAMTRAKTRLTMFHDPRKPGKYLARTGLVPLD